MTNQTMSCAFRILFCPTVENSFRFNSEVRIKMPLFVATHIYQNDPNKSKWLIIDSKRYGTVYKYVMLPVLYMFIRQIVCDINNDNNTDSTAHKMCTL